MIRSRRRLRPVVVAPVMAAAAVAVAVLVSSLAVPEPSVRPSAATAATLRPTPTAVEPLGVFRGARGRIVFRMGSHLEAVDPDRPGSALAIEPGDLGLGTRAMPAGWSADGTRLAISDSQGRGYVLDADGVLTHLRFDALEGSVEGCCSLGTSPWLSPDGASGVLVWPSGSGAAQLVLFEVGDPAISRTIQVELPMPFGGLAPLAMPAWSPDGSEIAYVRDDGKLGKSIVVIVDVASGRARALAAEWAAIRHVAWSPDGAELLVVASGEPPSLIPSYNRFWQPQEASLFRVAVDGGEPREILAGHFIVGAWSPDGGRVVAIDYPTNYRRMVVVVDADGTGDSREVADLGASGQFNGVVWHPLP